MVKIYIDPGHGGDSIGATYKGRIEQDDCLKLALAVEKYLLTQPGIEVKLSRRTNINPDIAVRAMEANNWGADYFLSIHRNAFKPNAAEGAEIWIISSASKQGETYKKAEKILKLVCEATDFMYRGVRLGAPSYKDFGVNSLTDMHSALLEAGFIDNDGDNAAFDKNFDKMALNIAKGLVGAVDMTWVDAKPAEPVKPTTDKKQMFRVVTGSFEERLNAEVRVEELRKAGFESFIDIIEIPGDIDGDGKVTAADARQVLRKSVGLE